MVGHRFVDRVGGNQHVDDSGTPGLSFAGNLGFLQLVFGYLLAGVAVSMLFLPHYFRGEMLRPTN